MSLEKFNLGSPILEHDVSVNGTILALLASNLGPGIVAIPFALYHMGLILGPLFVVFIGVASHLSMILYVKTKELMPYKSNSIWEVAYIMFGRSSLFVNCGTMFANSWSICVVSYIVIADTISSIFHMELLTGDKQVYETPHWQQALCHRSTILAIAGFICLLLIFKREHGSL